MAKKEELIAILVEAGIVTESNQEKFETLTNPDLESITEVTSKNQELEQELGKSESENSEFKNELELKNESLKTLESEKLELEKEFKKASDLNKELESELNFALKEIKDFKSEINPKEKSKKNTPGHEFKFRGEDYVFLDNVPKTITYGGVARTQKELSELDEADVLSLIGNLSLIKKIIK